MSYSRRNEDTRRRRTSDTTNIQNPSNQPLPQLTRLQRDNPTQSPSSRTTYRSTSSIGREDTRYDQLYSTLPTPEVRRENTQPDPEVTRLHRDNPVPTSDHLHAPPTQRSIFTSPNDAFMSRRQTHYAALNTHERIEQDTWAASIGARTGACLQGFKWIRKDCAELHGYICSMGNHAITDSLVAEGKGGCYGWSKYGDFNPLVGPWYKNDDGIWVYYGEGIPRGTINPNDVTNEFGEYCGIRALGWVDRDVYREPGMRYRTEWKYPY